MSKFSDKGRFPTDSNHKENPPKYYEMSVQETAAGHCIWTCNNPDAPFLKLRTAAGSIVEFKDDGGMVTLTMGDTQEATKGGKSSTCDENSCGKTWGHSRTLTGGESYSETGGEKGSGTGQTIAIVCMGKANIRCTQAYVGADGDLNMNVGGNFDIQVAGNFSRTVGGTDSTKAAKITHN